MKTLVVAALAATVALASAAAPAFAEEGHHDGRTVKKVIIHKDQGRHRGWHEGRHEGWRHHEGRHQGWRHENVSKKVIIKHGDHKTVIKKHEG
jgi:Ni/Co efflux regulator RcnB